MPNPQTNEKQNKIKRMAKRTRASVRKALKFAEATAAAKNLLVSSGQILTAYREVPENKRVKGFRTTVVENRKRLQFLIKNFNDSTWEKGSTEETAEINVIQAHMARLKQLSDKGFKGLPSDILEKIPPELERTESIWSSAVVSRLKAEGDPSVSSLTARMRTWFDGREFNHVAPPYVLRAVKRWAAGGGPEAEAAKSVLADNPADPNVFDIDDSVASRSDIRSRLTAKKLNGKDVSRYVAYIKATEEPLAPPEQRQKQFDKLVETLQSIGTGDAGELANEITLVLDALSDGDILNSPDVSSPAHAIELKRFGLKPCPGGRIGQFTDVHLETDFTNLGSGQQNTVSVGTYFLPGGRGKYKGVFKPEAGDISAEAGIDSGISKTNPRIGYRSVATSRLAAALDAGAAITRTEMAVSSGILGTVSEKAPGASPLGSFGRSTTKLEQEFVDQQRAGLGANWVEEFNQAREGSGRFLVEQVVTTRNGETINEFFTVDSTFRDINYDHPIIRRDLVRLQLLDGIAGQVDRHQGNYFVEQDSKGNVLGVKGIDNDLSWGESLTKPDNSALNDAVRLPRTLPPVVDSVTHKAILALTNEKLTEASGGLLTPKELQAAFKRLDTVKAHLEQLEKDGRVLRTLEDWTTPETTKLLIPAPDAANPGPPDPNRHTNYISRDVELKAEKKAAGLLRPFPAPTRLSSNARAGA